jgi:peptidoglycan/xylan/chitin deacetylase (PgdA/CDA1 family)
MRLRTVLGNARRQLLSGVARREVRLCTDCPLISFTFDDFPKTALFTGGAILGEHGLCGTYYAAPGLMGRETEVGHIFEQADLPPLLEAGHELAGHTYSHISARKTNLSAYHEDVRRGQQELAGFLGKAERLNFSYPFGGVTIAAKKQVGPTMRSCRGIFPGLDGPLVDLNLLHANSLYGGAERFAAAESLIKQNARQKSWLIFYTHDVQEKPSPYGCTPSLFEAAVRSAVDSGAEILTVTKALERVA